MKIKRLKTDRSNIEAKDNEINLQMADVLGVKVAISPMTRVIERIEEKIQERRFSRPFFVVTVNPEFVMETQKDAEFKKILNLADLAIADGNGLRFADQRLITVPGRSVVRHLVEGKSKKFYLGGKDGVAREMAERFSGGFDEGERDIKLGEKDNLRIIDKINTFRPDILFVAYGAPWQEKWIYRNLNKLRCRVVMGVGGSFDYLTGKASVPPEIVVKSRLEWLWRLVHEPWRWKRQMRLVKYLFLLFKHECTRN